MLQLVYVDPAAEDDARLNIEQANDVDIEHVSLVDGDPNSGKLEIYDLTQAINRGILCSAVPGKVCRFVQGL